LLEPLALKLSNLSGFSKLCHARLPETHPAKAAANKPPQPGHGRNAASDFSGAKQVKVPHTTLRSGDACPGCARGKVYQQKEPKPLVRIRGQAPLAAVRAGLGHARQSSTRLGRPATAAIKAAEVRKLSRQGISKSEISRRLDIGRTYVRRKLGQNRS